MEQLRYRVAGIHWRPCICMEGPGLLHLEFDGLEREQKDMWTLETINHVPKITITELYRSVIAHRMEDDCFYLVETPDGQPTPSIKIAQLLGKGDGKYIRLFDT